MIRIEKTYKDGFLEPVKISDKKILARWGNDTHWIFFEKGDENTSEWIAYHELLNKPGDPEVKEKIKASDVDIESIIDEIKKEYVLTPKTK